MEAANHIIHMAFRPGSKPQGHKRNNIKFLNTNDVRMA